MQGVVIRFVRYTLTDNFYIEAIPSNCVDKTDCYDCYLGHKETEAKEYVHTISADMLPKVWSKDILDDLEQKMEYYKEKHLIYTYPMAEPEAE